MKPPFVARLLENQAQVDRSFPVAHVGFGISLDRWRDFVAGWLQPGRTDCGILVVQDDADYMLGLCSFEGRDDLHCGRVLSVENFVALDLIGGQQVARLLLENLESYADARGIEAIRIGAAAARPASMRVDLLAEALSIAGYSAAAVHWLKAMGKKRAAFELFDTAVAH